MQNQCCHANNFCHDYPHNMTSIDNFSCLHCPSIEDRLHNTEKLIHEMNAKFEDIASNKHSAKHEFNKLVKTLTMTSDQNSNAWALDNNSNSDSDHQENYQNIQTTDQVNIRSSDNESDNDCSDNSSFDEET